MSVIDDDLGKSGSGLVERPGFQKLVATVCGGSVGSVFCIEASRLARNGRDWHHLIDLCALVNTLVIDHDGVYDPRLINDRLLLGLKGTMSEYELSLLRQRGLAARDAKARRGELRFALPPGYCWNELGRIEIDPDERVSEAIHLLFRKFHELGSARQVFLWAKQTKVKLPVLRQSPIGSCIEWRAPAYHTVALALKHPMYAGAYVFGRTTQRTQLIEGRARKSTGHHKPMEAWNVLIRNHHPGYITWEQFEANQKMLSENAHMQKRTARKSGRGGRALLTGLVRCGRCGRMLRVFYGMRSGHAHRYQCRGDVQAEYTGMCLGVGGVRVDRAIAGQILEAVSGHAVEAALKALQQVAHADADLRKSLEKELEQARYEAALALAKATDGQLAASTKTIMDFALSEFDKGNIPVDKLPTHKWVKRFLAAKKVKFGGLEARILTEDIPVYRGEPAYEIVASGKLVTDATAVPGTTPFHSHHVIPKWIQGKLQACLKKTWDVDEVPSVLLSPGDHLYPNGLHASIGDPALGINWGVIDTTFPTEIENADSAKQILDRLQDAYHNAERDDLMEVVKKWRLLVE